MLNTHAIPRLLGATGLIALLWLTVAWALS
jgi:hypothetical protein